MSDLRAVSLLPFVPSGSDYDESRRLFADLGFQELWENGGYAGFRNGDAQFILQKYDVKAFAENLMMRLNVPDLDAWWQVVSQLQLDREYPAFRINPPRKSFPGAGKSTSSIWLECAGTSARHDRASILLQLAA